MKNNLFLITKLLKSHLKETQKGGKMKLLCLLLSGVFFVDRNYYYSSFFLLFDFFLFFFFIFFFFPFTICCGSCLFGLKQNLSFSLLPHILIFNSIFLNLLNKNKHQLYPFCVSLVRI